MKGLYFDKDGLRTDIQTYLKDNDISIRNFSKKCGVNASVISRFLNGSYNPGLTTIERLTNGLNVDKDEYSNEQDFYDLTIEELTKLLHEIKVIRDLKINERMQILHEEITELELLQDEEL